MRSKLLGLFAAVAVLLIGTAARAAIDCSVSSSGFVTAYDTAVAGLTKVQASLTVSLRNGQQRPAEDFGGVGAEAQTKGDGAGGERAEGQVLDAEQLADTANQADGAEIDQQYPEQFGYAAHDGRIGAPEPAQRTVG